MANAWGCDGSQLYPPLMDAWCKEQLGFVKPIDITNAAGTQTVAMAALNAVSYRINLGPPGEYLLIENRQQISFDTPLPAGGLAIFHIDNTVADNVHPSYPGAPNWASDHYKVALLAADGQFNLEKGGSADASDFFRSPLATSLTPFTTPSTMSYQKGVFGNANNVYITGISASSTTMSFTYTKGPGPVTKCDGTNPCQNGGGCTPVGTTSYTCTCAVGFQGAFLLILLHLCCIQDSRVVLE